MYEWGVVGRGEKEVEKQKARGNREDTEEVQISVVEDLKNVSLPDTPKRVFQKRICVLIMSLVQTVEQRDARGWGENWPPLLQSSQGATSLLSLSVVRAFRVPVSLICTFVLFLSRHRHDSPLLSFFFFIPHSRLCLTSVAEFFRSTAIITPRRWKRKTVTENSWCKRGW